MVPAFGCVDASFEHGGHEVLGRVAVRVVQPEIDDAQRVLVGDLRVDVGESKHLADVLGFKGIRHLEAVNHYCLYHARYRFILNASFFFHPSASADWMCFIAAV